MRVMSVVIYTDKLAEVRGFYQKYFYGNLLESNGDNSLDVIIFGESRITYIDAQSASVKPSQGIVIRIANPFPALERNRLMTAGLACSDLILADWGKSYGQIVQYFSIADPVGTQLLIYEDRHGEEKQLITLGDGRGTKAVQKQP